MAFSWLPFAGPLLDAAFGLGGTKSRTKGATDAAAQQERYNREALDYLNSLRQQGRDDLIGFNAQGRDDILAGNAQARAYLEPYYQTGVNATDSLANETRMGGSPLNRAFSLADLQLDPGYQFRQTEGARGVEANAAGKGSVLSGATLKALERYRQGFASNELQNAYARFTDQQDRRYGQLAGLSAQGLSAGSQAAALGQAAGSQMGNMAQSTGQTLSDQAIPSAALGGSYITGIGDSQAAARAARGSAYGDFYGGLGQNAMSLASIFMPKRRTETLSY